MDTSLKEILAQLNETAIFPNLAWHRKTFLQKAAMRRRMSFQSAISDLPTEPRRELLAYGRKLYAQQHIQEQHGRLAGWLLSAIESLLRLWHAYLP